ncbi:MAG: 4Fe-4S binding protein [Candidatus Goldbacteria bacterium]|nr:4Fe-4S binding protein [Candidatus Goldiibacteriota bacterium]
MTTKPDIKTWKDLNVGGVLESGTSEHFKTGDWRSKVPVWQEKNCIQCLNCWAFCPDNAIKIIDGKRAGYDYDFCKGCGICAEECPKTTQAINAIKKEDPDAKVDSWDGAGNQKFAEKVSILMVSIKDAKEKYGIK